MGDSTFALGETLIERHAFQKQLRALDTLQLAVALELRDAGLIDYFVTADTALMEVATSEGLSVVNPLQEASPGGTG